MFDDLGVNYQTGLTDKYWLSLNIGNFGQWHETVVFKKKYRCSSWDGNIAIVNAFKECTM